MKINRNNIDLFQDIGTLVYYNSRIFYPEKTKLPDEYIDNYRETIESGHMYSSDNISDYLDFLKYNLKFELSEDKYWSIIKSNLYDNYTKKLISDFDGSLILPQLSKTENASFNKTYFGRITNTDKTYYIVKIPKNIWKIELYNSRIDSNNSVNSFMDYDILERFKNDYSKNYITDVPFLSIYFGPLYDTRISNYTFSEVKEATIYSSRYYSFDDPYFTESEYKSFSTIMDYEDYIKKYRKEIQGEKLLYIVVSNGTIENVNFFNLSYYKSKLQHRNQKEISFRNDSTISNQILDSNSVIFDKRNNNIYGTSECELSSDCPIFYGRLNRIDNDFYTDYRIYNEGEKIKLNENTFYSSNSSKMINDSTGLTYRSYENPEISPFWVLDEDYDSYYYHNYIKCSEGGTSEPTGLTYIKKDKDLAINLSPEIGYKFKSINISDYTLSRNKLTLKSEELNKLSVPINIKFSKINYKINFYIYCSMDFYRSSGKESSGSLSDLKKYGLSLYIYNYNIETYQLYKTGNITCDVSNPLKFKIISDNRYYCLENVYYRDFINKKDISRDDHYEIVIDSENYMNSLINIVSEVSSRLYSITITKDEGIQTSKPRETNLYYGQTYSLDIDYSSPISITIYKDGKLTNESNNLWKIEDNSGLKTVTIFKESIKNNFEIVIKYEN